MFSRAVAALLILASTPALSQLVLPSASRSPPSVSPTSTEQINITSTLTGIASNATSHPILPPNACIIFMSANGTVPGFTITSEFPFPTGISNNFTTITEQVNTTCTGQNNAAQTVYFNSTQAGQVNSTVLGPLPTNITSFATTFYATIYTSSGIPTTTFPFPPPSGLPLCPNITSVNSTGLNNTIDNSSHVNQSLKDTADKKPSSAASVLHIGRDLAGAAMGAIAGVALAVL